MVYLSEIDDDAAALGLHPVRRQLWGEPLLGAFGERQAAAEERLLVLVLQVGHKLLHCMQNRRAQPKIIKISYKKMRYVSSS
jgi:hypothetical protein